MPLTENRFNLVDEPWIPVAGHGLVSLADIFSKPELPSLGGNPIQKIALLKLVLAIAQSAYTPKDDEDWKQLGSEGMAEKCLKYLNDKKDLFWLYGEKPFLQMPAIISTIKGDAKEKNKEPKIIGNGDFPNLSNENNTILLQSEAKNSMSDAEKALFILTLMSFALAGKQCHCNHKKPAIVGPSLGRVCYLHSFLTGKNIHETLYLNLFSLEALYKFRFFEEGLGIPPWEEMPNSSECVIAKKLKKSYLGTLVSMCRFVLLRDDGIFMMEGLQYKNHKEGWIELSIAVNSTGKDIKVLRANIVKKPWRELTSLMSFISGRGLFDCPQIAHALNNAKKHSCKTIQIWSGGLAVSGDSFGQKVSGTDDFVESEVKLQVSVLGIPWFVNLEQEMEQLDRLVWSLKSSVYKANKSDVKDSNQRDKRANAISENAEALFWQLCERKFQNLVDACASKKSDEELKKLRKTFAGFVNKAYDTYCPKDTARQLDAWAANKPKLARYLIKTMEGAI
ncbi:MAG: type I-E CRISPR-associated protein Cse1/CasA [Candidatus Omnitrophica bacterium]|nr:type I-E CRISPR-associated protein Cse1/CasA [Candidatus Omnitrophota bacterium]